MAPLLDKGGVIARVWNRDGGIDQTLPYPPSLGQRKKPMKRELKSMNHNELGKWGEQRATEYLAQKGYDILERNWFYDKAEIDIIAKDGDTVVMVEVKTRNSAFFGDPQDFVSNSKIKLMVKAANEYIVENDLDVEVRFDIVAILKNKHQEQLEHFEDAFYFF